MTKSRKKHHSVQLDHNSAHFASKEQADLFRLVQQLKKGGASDYQMARWFPHGVRTGIMRLTRRRAKSYYSEILKFFELNTRHKEDVINTIKLLRDRGYTLQAIGNLIGVTRQAVHYAFNTGCLSEHNVTILKSELEKIGGAHADDIL